MVCLGFAVIPSAQALDPVRPEVHAFIEKMSTEQGFAAADVGFWLAQARTQQAILDAMAKPAESVLTWQEYKARFLTEQRISQGVDFWLEHRELLDRISLEHGVPPQYILGILGVETSYGRITGKYRVIDALSTLAFDYPPRSKYFIAELEQFLLLAREESLDPTVPLGSYAGAMGPPQFMPRSVRNFAVDADGDGKRDLWSNWADVLGSIANYLKKHGWKSDEGVTVELPPADSAPDAKPTGSHNFGVILKYNRSPLYAMTVHDLATALIERVTADETPQ